MRKYVHQNQSGCTHLVEATDALVPEDLPIRIRHTLVSGGRRSVLHLDSRFDHRQGVEAAGETREETRPPQEELGLVEALPVDLCVWKRHVSYVFGHGG